MKITPRNVFTVCRRCLCRSSARESWSTPSSKNNFDDDAQDLFESEDFCEVDKFSALNIDPEKVNIRDPAMKQRMRSLQTEIYLLNESGGEVPGRLSSKQWLDLLTIDSPEMRAVYLQKLWYGEQMKSNRLKSQTIKRKLYLEAKEKSDEQGPFVDKDDIKYVHYGLNFNTLFRGIYSQTMNRFYHYRLFKAMVFGPDIVVDCGYDKEMRSKDLHRCARDIHHMWISNKFHANPFNIRFCNLSDSGLLFPRLRDHFPDFDEPDLPFDYTSLSYLDFYDRKRLVYLTPYSLTNLTSYDPKKVYIIGALPNSNRKGPLSIAKAKREGLSTAKFPFFPYVDWNAGLKSVKASTALAIMNDLKEQRDWRTIFKHHLPVINYPPQETFKEQEKEKEVFSTRPYEL